MTCSPSRFAALALALALCAPRAALAEEAAPVEAPTLGALPDLKALHESGWQGVAWTTHRSRFNARKAGVRAELWNRWGLPPRPGDRSLLVMEGEGLRLGLVFHEVKGLVRIEILTGLSPEDTVQEVKSQLGRGVRATDRTPLPVVLGWVDELTVVVEVDGGSAVVVEAPRELTDGLTLLPHEPWDREGPVSREAAQARLAVGIPLLATCFVSALVMLPFATKQPAASIAVAAPLGAGISIGTALTISGATKLRGALPKAELDAWDEGGPLRSPAPAPGPGLQ